METWILCVQCTHCATLCMSRAHERVTAGAAGVVACWDCKALLVHEFYSNLEKTGDVCYRIRRAVVADPNFCMVLFCSRGCSFCFHWHFPRRKFQFVIFLTVRIRTKYSSFKLGG